jgi:hypothetical protein
MELKKTSEYFKENNNFSIAMVDIFEEKEVAKNFSITFSPSIIFTV